MLALDPTGVPLVDASTLVGGAADDEHERGGGRPIDWSKPVSLWFGNERGGLTSEALAECTHHVSLPKPGMVESFNVSAAAAMAMLLSAARRRSALAVNGTSELDESMMETLIAEYTIRGIGRAKSSMLAKRLIDAAVWDAAEAGPSAAFAARAPQWAREHFSE